MGCSNSRSLDLQLLEAQETLGFAELDPHQIDLTLRKYSFEGWINQKQFTEIVYSLGLEVTNIEEGPQAEKMYHSIRDIRGINMKVLMTIAMQTSTASFKTRAKLVYELYDDTFEKRLPVKALELLVNNCVFVALSVLPVLYGHECINEIPQEALKAKYFMLLDENSCISKRKFLKHKLTRVLLEPAALRLMMRQEKANLVKLTDLAKEKFKSFKKEGMSN
mmetsp:Transcript_26826/g.48343  ORF Transcript_26826/g.48343 Transcript_26826/m.48343 type:complete len:221 (+) Transcript_26826:1319-1981(+)